MVFNNYNLHLESDFEIRLIREDNNDFDLFIPLENRVLNMLFYSMPKYLSNRVQFPRTYGILLRGAKSSGNNKASLFIMKNLDLHSAAIFEIDYSLLSFQINDLENYAELKLLKRKEK